jgi:hypothetical protein
MPDKKRPLPAEDAEEHAPAAAAPALKYVFGVDSAPVNIYE